MNTLNIAQQDQINEMTAEGKTSGQIARELKIKKAIIEAFLAEQTPVVLEGELITGQEGVVVEDAPASTEVVVEEAIEGVVVDAVVEQEPVNDVASKLAAMLAQANAAPATTPAKELTRGGNIKVQASSSKNADGTNKQRRNTNVGDRAVAVITSESMKTCFIGTHLGFATKKYDSALNVFRTAPQQALKDMQKATDLVMVLEYQNIALGDYLETLKATAFEKYSNLGYTMLCRKPKAAPLAAEAPATEETAETPVTEEVPA